MEHPLAWRMAWAKNLLRRKEGGVADVARARQLRFDGPIANVFDTKQNYIDNISVI